MFSQSPALLFSWVAWCLLHSLLASRRIKKLLAERAGLGPRYYRLSYVIFATVSLTALLIWQYSILNLSVPAGPAWQLPRLLLSAYGLFMLWAGSRSYNFNEFLGLDAFAENRPTAIHLRRDGILGRLRHPWYSGGIALVFALGETPLDRLDWRLLLIGYLVIGCLIEERRLVDELGEEYRRYQQEVPMLIPRFWSGKR